jgi:hypothetical protein
VVDARRAVVHLIERDADQIAEVADRPEDAVAEADRADVGGDDGGPPDVHRHRVGVVEQQRVGAELAHVGREGRQCGERAQRPKDPADAGRVADRLAQAVARRQLEVGDRRRDAADLDHIDDEVSAVEGFAPVEGRADRGSRAEPFVQLSRCALGHGEPGGVDVVQGQFDALQFGKAEQVGDELAGEDDASRADEGDPCHPSIILRTARFAQSNE